MILKACTRLYESEISMNHAVGSLKRYGWKIKRAGKNSEGMYEIQAYKAWEWVHKMMEAWRAAKAIILADRMREKTSLGKEKVA